MKIRHCFFSPVFFEVFSSKIPVHCSDCIKHLLTESAFPLALAQDLGLILFSLALTSTLLVSIERQQCKSSVGKVENQTSCQKCHANCLPHSETLLHNNILIDIDDACCTHLVFL